MRHHDFGTGRAADFPETFNGARLCGHLDSLADQVCIAEPDAPVHAPVRYTTLSIGCPDCDSEIPLRVAATRRDVGEGSARLWRLLERHLERDHGRRGVDHPEWGAF